MLPGGLKSTSVAVCLAARCGALAFWSLVFSTPGNGEGSCQHDCQWSGLVTAEPGESVPSTQRPSWGTYARQVLQPSSGRCATARQGLYSNLYGVKRFARPQRFNIRPWHTLLGPRLFAHAVSSI